MTRAAPGLLVWLVLLAACGQSAPRQQDQPDQQAGGSAQGVPVLRAIYRDVAHHMLVVLPDADHRMAHGDCAAPLLIDDATGRARQITPAQAAQAMRHMQLSGAVHGTFP